MHAEALPELGTRALVPLCSTAQQYSDKPMEGAEQ